MTPPSWEATLHKPRNTGHTPEALRWLYPILIWQRGAKLQRTEATCPCVSLKGSRARTDSVWQHSARPWLEGGTRANSKHLSSSGGLTMARHATDHCKCHTDLLVISKLFYFYLLAYEKEKECENFSFRNDTPLPPEWKQWSKQPVSKETLTSQLCHLFGIFGLNFCSQTTFLISSTDGSEGTRS